MTNQPESGGNSLPRPNSGLPVGHKPSGKSGFDSANEEPVESLPTLTPRLRRRPTEPSKAHAKLIRREPDSGHAKSSKQSEQGTRTAWVVSPFKKFCGDQPVDEKLLDESMRRALDTDPDEFDDENLLSSVVRKRLIPIPSFLFSLAVHLAIFLAFALIMFNTKVSRPSVSIVAEIDSTPTQVKPEDTAVPDTVKVEIPETSNSALDSNFDAAATDEKMELADSKEIMPNLVADAVDPTPVETELVNAVKKTLPSGGGLEGREAASRAKLAASRGGSEASEMAVENGIRWIINHQREDGSWHFRHDDGNCNGECRNQGTQESTTAATGLALLTMLGAGYTQRTGPYQEEMQKGLQYLRTKMRHGPHGGSLIQGESGMYSHAIATIALCEAYMMTRDTSLPGAVEHARKYIESAQHKQGGWRYVPGTKGDMTVTGWQIMALKSCEMAGIGTGEVTWDRAEAFVNSLGTSDGRFGYQHPDSQTPTTTAVGMLSKMYLGEALEDGGLELGAQYLSQHKPSKTDMYFNYYATLVLHHRQDPDWPEWNVALRDYLVNTQEKGDKHNSGSWYFADKHGKTAGRLYTTAMAVMTLEVYYRYMPLYETRAMKKP